MTDFGCSTEYSAGLFSRASGALICRFDDRFDASWARKLDRTSDATITVKEDCCSCVPVPWAHEIGIYRAGQAAPVWQGPVDEVDDSGRELRISAFDKSAYWYKRLTTASISHAGAPVDASVFFAELVAQAEAGAPSGLAFVPTSPTGVLIERVADIDQKIGPFLNDMADAAIDWTVVGLQAFAGGVTVPAGGALVLVTADHWDQETPPEVVTEGRSQITRVVVHAQGDITAIYPPGPAVADPVFGIVEEEISKPEIPSQAEADAYAQSYYDRHQGPQIHISTAGSSLSKRFPYGLPDLIPGRLFEVLVNSGCGERLLSLRLSAVSVDISGGHEESVKIDLQPVGQNEEIAP